MISHVGARQSVRDSDCEIDCLARLTLTNTGFIGDKMRVRQVVNRSLLSASVFIGLSMFVSTGCSKGDGVEKPAQYAPGPTSPPIGGDGVAGKPSSKNQKRSTSGGQAE